MKILILILTLASFQLHAEKSMSFTFSGINSDNKNINHNKMPAGLSFDYKTNGKMFVGVDVDYFNANFATDLKAGVRLNDLIISAGIGLAKTTVNKSRYDEDESYYVNDYYTDKSKQRSLKIEYRKAFIKYSVLKNNYGFESENLSRLTVGYKIPF